MVERSVIYEMLDELRFDDAEMLMDTAEEKADLELREEITRRRAEAEQRAGELANRIVELGETHQLETVAELGQDPTTGALLALAPASSQERAQLYLREADRWAENRRETNARRLAEAHRALVGLDFELAKGLMRRIDGRYLSADQVEERDRLLLDISARAMEVESLTAMGRQLSDDSRSRKGNQRKLPWWRRRFG